MKKVLPFFGLFIILLLSRTVWGDPLYPGLAGPTAPASPALMPQSPAYPQINPSGPSLNPSLAPGQSAGPSQGTGQNGNNTQPQPTSPSEAPTFMNNSMPNSVNPLNPTATSPGTFSSPLINNYILNGVPAMAAPLMATVYQPFGLTMFQPNPYQVTPQGTISLTGTAEYDTNMTFSPNQPTPGEAYSISPAIAYSNFDDYGYASLLGSASYYQYDAGSNISPYVNEMGGVSAGTYLGNRVFVGVEDFVNRGDTPQNIGSPLEFLNGVQPYLENTAGAEVGIAITPRITFVETANDFYFDATAFGAGIDNIQSLMQTLNFNEGRTYLSATYMYSQGSFSLFPGFISNGGMGSANRVLSRQTSIGVGGSYIYYEYQGDPLANFTMFSEYGMINHQFTKRLSGSIEGGWNGVTFEQGQTYQSPMIDLGLTYSMPNMSIGINLGEYMENQTNYGIEMGPEKIKSALGFLNRQLGAKTSLTSMIGYTQYTFLNAPVYSNNFFQTLQPTQSYTGTDIIQTDMITWKTRPWLTTGIMYNLIDFSSNIQSTNVIDNQFIAFVSMYYSFE
ncbi:hypothetical protein [Leptospirillum ferrooxidans]|uniref:Uncharacterized protein n=1 Tax=Leptospirillum ferrooxidans (strain C2-3) TaxID=1162668 RepID=I0IRM0_LEPFC|nr:hypothetical protein [Leptospirillum ferrooxidans]BAM07919.1 hypothetical protein LFE_2247 [Leptospirillum ferrooxidans C2-3]